MIDITAWTDGACSGNPGPGGWAYIIEPNFLFGGESFATGSVPGMTTNNRMELIAAINLLDRFDMNKGVKLTVKSDSGYLVKGFMEWAEAWEAKGWITSEGDEAKNIDLWKLLLIAKRSMNVTMVQVRRERNTRADHLAKGAIPGGGTSIENQAAVDVPPDTILLITGSRDSTIGMNRKATQAVERAKANGWQVIVGDADGVDLAVITACDFNFVPVTVYGGYGHMRHETKTGRNVPLSVSYPARDDVMAGICSLAATVWNGESKGTVYTAACVAKYQKVVHWLWKTPKFDWKAWARLKEMTR